MTKRRNSSPAGRTAASLADEVAAQVIAMMETEGLHWVRRWSVPVPPCNALSGHRYRGVNVFTTAIWMMCNETSDARFVPRSALFTKEPEKRVGQLRKGEKGIPILFFNMVEKRDEQTGEERSIPFAKVYYVWHVSQIDNLDETKVIPMQEPTGAGAERDAGVDAFVTHTGAEIRHAPQAFYVPAEDWIGTPPRAAFLPGDGVSATEHYYSTLLHELVHWTGHRSRLDRDMADKPGRRIEERAFEELIAEIGSVMLGMTLGVQAQPRTDNAAYLKSWIARLRERPRAIFDAAAAANRALTFLEERQPRPEMRAEQEAA